MAPIATSRGALSGSSRLLDTRRTAVPLEAYDTGHRLRSTPRSLTHPRAPPLSPAAATQIPAAPAAADALHVDGARLHHAAREVCSVRWL